MYYTRVYIYIYKIKLRPKPVRKPSLAMPQGVAVNRGMQSADTETTDTTVSDAVKELKLSYYTGETRLFTIYTHYGNLI